MLSHTIGDCWHRLTSHRAEAADAAPPLSVIKLQHSLTASVDSIDAALWLRLDRHYQQTILVSLTLNDSTSVWLSAPCRWSTCRRIV